MRSSRLIWVEDWQRQVMISDDSEGENRGSGFEEK